MNLWNHRPGKVIACATLLIALGSCSGGGSGGGGTTTPPAPAGSVTITGTVSGTIIKVVRADNGTVIAETDTAPLISPPFPFTLSNIPVGVSIRAFFFSAGETFSFYSVNPQTNVFKISAAGTIDLGMVTMSGGRATAMNTVTNVIFEPEDISPPAPNVIPPPATLTVTTPAPGTGSVIVEFGVQNFVIGGQGQQHLHIQVGNGETRHFFNGQTDNVLDDSNQPATDVRRQNDTSFRLDGLAPGQYQATVRLATASESEFVNPEAEAVVPITITNPPVPPATLTVTSPQQGVSLPSGPVAVSFTVQAFTIGGLGSPHLHMYLDSDPVPYHFYNGASGQVLYQGSAAANVQWQSNTSFQLTGLSSISHVIRLRLADAADQELSNVQAQPPDLNFTVQSPPGSNATLSFISPNPGDSVPPGPVLVIFNIQNSPVTTADIPRMQFSLDNNTSVLYKFYDGPGITENGATSGVRYQNVHTHFVHWKSGNSVQFNALAAGPHTVKFVLLDLNGAPLSGTDKTLNFTLQQGTLSDLFLEEVVDGLNFPTAMATTLDGTIFVTEKQTGNIRVVRPRPQPQQWELQPVEFAHLTNFETENEKGLLGIAIDPSFNSNHFVYAFYTAAGPINRVVRFTAMTSNGNTVAAPGAPTVILDNIPAAENHNGGFIRFGPDGMLYIFTGENDIDRIDAQDLGSLKGKILRINKDGSIPSDNPFLNNPSANPRVYSYGHRNGFGLTFHPHTGDLWESENGEDNCDQINRIVRRGNYGWPNSPCGGNPLYIDPAWIFTGYSRPTIAPTGIVAIGENSIYPVQYHNNLLVADFNYGWLHHLVLTGNLFDTIASETVVCQCGQGGLLSIMQGLNVPGQDGYIYVTNGEFSTSNHSIFRVRFNP